MPDTCKVTLVFSTFACLRGYFLRMGERSVEIRLFLHLLDLLLLAHPHCGVSLS